MHCASATAPCCATGEPPAMHAVAQGSSAQAAAQSKIAPHESTWLAVASGSPVEPSGPPPCEPPSGSSAVPPEPSGPPALPPSGCAEFALLQAQRDRTASQEPRNRILS